jgi:CxxC motif-containing protein (DUF1111 family)
MRILLAPCAVLASVLATACGHGPEPLRVITDDPSDAPIAGATADDLRVFAEGDLVFDRVFRPSQGIGPVFIQASCRACHGAGGRGPGSVTRRAIVDRAGEPADAARWLPYGSTARPRFAAGATRGVTAPVPAEPDRLLRSVRVGPAVFGRGWIEAVADESILAQERLQAGIAGPVSGRVNRLADGRIGRLGVKARLADLESFAAEAFQGDMGLTSPRAPAEVPNPDGLTDDLRPGVDLRDDVVRAAAGYVRRLAIPARAGLAEPGRRLFADVGCADCHAPSLRTRADYPVAAMAAQDAALYSDLLLHDLGPSLADGITGEGVATGREWRTAPLMGVRFFRSFLHDGRAGSIEEAVRLHGGDGSEAAASVRRFDALPAGERAALVDFVRRL